MRNLTGILLFILAFSFLFSEEGAAERNLKKRIDSYEKLCGEGNPFTCLLLSEIYSSGNKAEKDELKADEYYKRSAYLLKENCNRENFNECVFLGNLYYAGKGFEKNVNEALYYYYRACIGGWRKGCSKILYIKENNVYDVSEQFLSCSQEKLYYIY